MKKNDLTFLFGSGLLLVVAWILLSIYHQSVTSTIPQAVTIQIAPIDPIFDVQTIDLLKKRQSIPPVYEIQQEASPQAQLQQVPLATPAARSILP